MEESKIVRFEMLGKVGHFILERPPVNALSLNLIAELEKTACRITDLIQSGQDDIRAVVISSGSAHFCAGADLKERRQMSDSQVKSAVGSIKRMTNAIADIPVPTIAAINGSAIGGGTELALAADIRILAESAKMGLREAALGIIPGAGGTQRLPRLIGYSAALYWITSARIFDAKACLAYGVANQLAADDDLLDQAFALAEEIAANAPVAVRAAKEAIKNGLETDAASGMKIETACYEKTIPTQDRKEALAAFAEKRPPAFKGC